MSKTSPTANNTVTWWQRVVSRLVQSRWVNWLVNLPPIAWLTRIVVRVLVKRRVGEISIEEAPVEQAVGIGLEATLQHIVYDVVEALGYAGAMVATYEQGDSLPVRAFYVDPNLATGEQIQQWEAEVSKYTEHPISLTDPAIARVFVYQDEYNDNLSVKAFQAGGPVTSDDLFDLFVPIAPQVARPIVKGIQQALGIHTVIAIPFFLTTVVEGQAQRAIVGNLFAAKRSEISKRDERVLAAFGRQAAAAIESERRRIYIQVAQEIVFELQSSLHDEERILQRIAEWIVTDLGYVGAMVATYEQDDSLPVRVLCTDPNLATATQIRQWEAEVSRYTEHPVSFSDPAIARVLVHQEKFQDNLSVQAVKTGVPVFSNDLYDILTPVAPPSSRPIIKSIQEALGIQQIIAVPFFLPKQVEDRQEREIVGNLFVATRSRVFSAGEVGLLIAFGQQAAAGIRNARLYREAEERREVAQIFGKMAFSAAAFVHALRNHIGAFRTHLHLLKVMPPDQRDELFSMSDRIDKRLEDVSEILLYLHEPWKESPDVLTEINGRLKTAIERVIPKKEELEADEGITLQLSMADDLPQVKTSPDMLTEAFRVLVKNGLEAVREKGGGVLRIETRRDGDLIQVQVSDTGIGIEPENLGKIFELMWSTRKEAGMGFGLFWTKEYIEGLGGKIEVESVWQEGSTFRLSFPVVIE